MSDLKKMSMSQLIAMHNELAAKLGVGEETSFKNLAAARAAVTNLENKMNQDFDPTPADAVDGEAVAPKNNQVYNSSGKRGPTQGIGAYAKERILAGKTNPEILAEIAERFPSAKTTAGCIAYYRTALAKGPKKAALSPAEQLAAAEAALVAAMEAVEAAKDAAADEVETAVSI